ncbi:MAG: hypothetical protein LUI87_12885 [Lachnospiraceae bacterium]|nr:hypothetical protein [Lachnospiraceae bacterium]
MKQIFQLSNVQFLYNAFRTAIKGVEWFVLAYFICIIMILNLGRKEWKDVFARPLVFMAVTIYNPFLIVPVAELINLTTRIRRIFWLMPVNLVLAFVLTAVCTAAPGEYALLSRKKWSENSLLSRFCVKKQASRIIRYGIVVCMVLLITALGTSVIPNLHMTQNRYKVDSALVTISDYLEKDTAATGLDKVVLYSDTLLLELREFDPSIESALRRDELLTYSPDLEDEEAIQETVNSKSWLKILALVSRFQVQVDMESFQNAMDQYGVNYIIMIPNEEMDAYYTEAGYPLATKIGAFAVYRRETG